MGSQQKIESLCLGGYKSFPGSGSSDSTPPAASTGPAANGQRVAFGDVTVLIGTNGAGKSNVVSFFQLLGFMMTGALQDFIGREGGARSLLHYGPEITREIDMAVVFSDGGSRNAYTAKLTAAAPDTLIFTNESIEYQRSGHPEPQQCFLGAGQKETALVSETESGNRTAGVMLALLGACRTYQFHDTSETAGVRRAHYIEDAKYLRADAGNLAAFLHRLRRTHPEHVDRIARTVRQVCPQFGRFELEPTARDERYILLNWYERHRDDYLMGPHQLSDGTLRFMALATLFLQPSELLPGVIVIDEPELGLHPQAVAAVADMVHGLAGQSQVVLATQSVTLVNHFDIADIRIVEHTAGRSHVLNVDPAEYEAWLAEYTTGQLWEKNVIGGGPRYE